MLHEGRKNGVQLLVFDQKPVVAERGVDLAVEAPGNLSVQFAHLTRGEDDVGRDSHDECPGTDPAEGCGYPAAAAPDDRSYSELTLGSVVSDDGIVCSVSETGVLTFTGECSVYAPYGGTVQSVLENEGTYTMEIEHTTSFSTVIAGLTSAYLAAGDAVYATIPVGYCAGGEISVSMYDGGTLISAYTVNENNDIVWNA